MTKLETVSLTVPEHALEPFEAAVGLACHTVGLFLTDEARRIWTVEGVRAPGHADAQLRSGLMLANAADRRGARAGCGARPRWEAGSPARGPRFRSSASGRRFAIRGTHLPAPPRARAGMTLVLDAGVAFGSGEHNSTRGCLRALERVAYRRPRRILDLGCGSAILAMAAARLLHRPVLATDSDAWSVRVAAENARLNGLGGQVHCRVAAGWQPVVCAGAPYDLVFANILARPLCAMAGDLAAHLAPGGTAILAGLLDSQVRMVLAAHRRSGLVGERVINEGTWATLVVRKPHGRTRP